MELKPVNKIDSDANTIRVSDGNSPIRLIFKDSKGEVINLYDKIDYFYLTKDDEKFYSVTDISYDGDEVIIRLPKLRKGKYKAEIRDKDGSIYPANEDLYILLRRSFEDDKDIYYFGHREDILNNVEPIIIQHIEQNPNKFKGERGQQGFPGRDGLRGIDGKDGKDGIDGLDGRNGIDGKDGEKGEKGDPGISESELNAIVDDKVSKQKKNIVVNIPTDYPDLQTALDKNTEIKTTQGKTISLNIETGYVVTSGLRVSNGDYSHFVVTSDDDIVIGDLSSHFIYGKNSHMPVLGCLVDLQGTGGTGYYAENSRGTVLPNCGVKNAKENGLYSFKSSNVSANDSIFSGASFNNSHYTGATCRLGSSLSIDRGDVSGSHYYGLSSASGSQVSAVGINADNCARHAIRADESSTLNCFNSTAKNAGRFGIYAWNASIINGQHCDVSGSSRGFYSADSSNVNASGGIANDCEDYGVFAYSGSNLNAQGVIAKNCDVGVRSDSGSTVNIRGATITDNTTMDIQINGGGTISAVASTYQSSSHTENQINSAGIIYK